MNPPTTSDLVFVVVNMVIVWSVMRLEKRICDKLSEIEKNTRPTGTTPHELLGAMAREVAKGGQFRRALGDLPPPPPPGIVRK